ncbi:Adenosine deaminase [Lotmaria passim]
MKEFYFSQVETALLPRSLAGIDTSALHTDVADPMLLLEGLRRVPKIDLHCHLNGSISPAMLAHMERLLLDEHRRRSSSSGGGSSNTSTAKDSGAVKQECGASPTTAEAEEDHLFFFNTQEKRMRNVLASPTADDAKSSLPGASATHSSPKDRMNYCFSVFDAIYKVMTNLAFTRLAAQDMLICAAAENIAVMEIRTSLRDGLQRSFRRSSAQATTAHNNEGTKEAVEGGVQCEPVSKQTYVDTVIQTVEHLLAGGLVDFESGELLSMADSAAVLAGVDVAVEEPADMICESNSKGAPLRHNDTAKRWWRVFDRVYTSQFVRLSLPRRAVGSSGATTPADFDTNSGVHRHRHFFVQTVHPNLARRMHVRLLLSINRASGEAAAWEAARLTTRTQQRQIRAFHAWCCAKGDATDKSSPRSGSFCKDASERLIARARVTLSKLRQTCWVTGIDLSGNCYKGRFAMFKMMLQAARDGVVPPDAEADRDLGAVAAPSIRTSACVTIHGGEKVDAAELSEMAAFCPERWGHLVFTDDVNLEKILASRQPIELCLTSNLLTSGHADVEEHHLGHLMELWDRMQESRWPKEVQPSSSSTSKDLSTEPCFACTKAANEFARKALLSCRRGEPFKRRVLDLVGMQECPKKCDVLSTETLNDDTSYYILPNLSLNTDDRGVFGTTLSDELLLASQHPAVRRMCSRIARDPAHTVAGMTQFCYYFEHLSLPHVFELPLPVALLAVLMTEGQGQGGTSTPTNFERAAMAVYGEALKFASEYSSPTAEAAAAWCDWNVFVQMCADVEGKQPASRLPVLLSSWELAWLRSEFEHYYL